MTNAINGNDFSPVVMPNLKYKHWITILDKRRYAECRNKHGKIYELDESPEKEPPLHKSCRCTIQKMESIRAGTATTKGTDGADWWVMNNGRLPEYYVGKDEAADKGWNSKL